MPDSPGEYPLNDSIASYTGPRILPILKLPVLIILILIGIFLEGFVHFQNGIPIVYTHFFYLIVAVASLWYGKKAIGIALFFGGFHVAVSWYITGSLLADAVIRAGMLVLVAAVIGIVVDRMNTYHNLMLAQNTALKEINQQLESSEKAFLTANKKLNLLSSITRHDIKNQLTALLMYLGISRMNVTNAEQNECIDQEELAANNILRQIEFTRMYEDIGVNEPRWQMVTHLIDPLKAFPKKAGIEIAVQTGRLELFADPLLAKVFENLIDNSLRHGEHVQHIVVSAKRDGPDLVLCYEDDGIGILSEDKERIFEKGYGKHTGLGLFLIREIISITGLSIRETGTYGKGACFEILIPSGRFKYEGEFSGTILSDVRKLRKTARK
jgi:signal transduction histidine kinase